jgi:hypothetical protein
VRGLVTIRPAGIVEQEQHAEDDEHRLPPPVSSWTTANMSGNSAAMP